MIKSLLYQIRACDYTPEFIVKLLEVFLDGSRTGTINIALARPVDNTLDPSDQDYKAKQRIQNWIEDRWYKGLDFCDTEAVLLEFQKFLAEREADRQRG
jgi:hypothetical protein